MIRAVTLAVFSLAAPAAAREPILQFPLDCTLGTSCFIQQYTDADPGSGARDFTCGPLSYDGHKGTDFALPFTNSIDAGVDVFAAAPGTVISVRDGMLDHLQGTENAPDITNRECGNGVLVGHGDGWQTQYCHLKRGSVRVRKGQSVSNATPIGQVGMSGRTQFPHLHLSVRQNGRVVDPFNAADSNTCGEQERRSLWQDTPTYQAGGLIALGFSDAVPEYDAIRAGDADHKTLTTDAPALVFWAFGFGARSGDVLSLTITGPAGEVLSQRVTLNKQQAQYFRASGRRHSGTDWPAGTYIGQAELYRGSALLDQNMTDMTVTP